MKYKPEFLREIVGLLLIADRNEFREKVEKFYRAKFVDTKPMKELWERMKTRNPADGVASRRLEAIDNDLVELAIFGGVPPAEMAQFEAAQKAEPPVRRFFNVQSLTASVSRAAAVIATSTPSSADLPSVTTVSRAISPPAEQKKSASPNGKLKAFESSVTKVLDANPKNRTAFIRARQQFYRDFNVEETDALNQAWDSARMSYTRLKNRGTAAGVRQVISSLFFQPVVTATSAAAATSAPQSSAIATAPAQRAVGAPSTIAQASMPPQRSLLPDVTFPSAAPAKTSALGKRAAAGETSTIRSAVPSPSRGQSVMRCSQNNGDGDLNLYLGSSGSQGSDVFDAGSQEFDWDLGRVELRPSNVVSDSQLFFAHTSTAAAVSAVATPAVASTAMVHDDIDDNNDGFGDAGVSDNAAVDNNGGFDNSGAADNAAVVDYSRNAAVDNVAEQAAASTADTTTHERAQQSDEEILNAFKRAKTASRAVGNGRLEMLSQFFRAAGARAQQQQQALEVSLTNLRREQAGIEQDIADARGVLGQLSAH